MKERCKSAIPKRSRDINEKKGKHEEKGDANNLLIKLAIQHRISRQSMTSQNEHVASNMSMNVGVGNSSRPVSSTSHSHGSAELPEWFEDLTADNEDAFKELFDMLDSAKTGTLNVDSMYQGLKRVDSAITREEVEAVMAKLDKGGNGEINFDEFLIHMTHGDLAGNVDQGDGTTKKTFTRRQRILYTAITQFSMKHWLEQERKRRQPHLIKHYTAGARLEGLTARQLVRQMRKLQTTAKKIASPYAKPPPFVKPRSKGKDQKRKYQSATERSEIRPHENRPQVKVKITTESSEPLEWKTQWKLFASRKSVIGKTEEELMSKIRCTLKNEVPTIKITPVKPDKVPVKSGKIKKILRVRAIPQIGKVRVPLPGLKVKYINKRPTIEDLPNIREKATQALKDYYFKLQKANVKNSYEHWDALYADTIRPKKLLDNFRKVYEAYSPQKVEEAFVVCPWTPNYRNFRRKPVSHERPFSAP